MATNGSNVLTQSQSRQSNPPSQTLYLNNISDKLNKSDLRRALYTVFSTHGTVLDVVALKTSKMRGQAHVVFRDVQTSSQAMRSLQGFEFFGKELRISFGKGKSDIISRLDGSAKTREIPKIQTTMTDAQKSAFGAAPAPKTSSYAQAGVISSVKPNGSLEEDTPSTKGLKRRREDGSDEEEASMEEDDDEDAMEESDDD